MSESFFISLVVATVVREKELLHFLCSVEHWGRCDVEVIIADQNADDRLLPVIRQFNGTLHLRHLRLEQRGASLARNAGAVIAKGEWICFPDDDCWYRRDVLHRLEQIIDSCESFFICGDVVDLAGIPLNRYRNGRTVLSPYNSYGRISEAALFAKRQIFLDVGGFDPEFGPGGRWPAAEGLELLLRFLKRYPGRAFFEPSLVCIHPRKDSSERSWQIGYGLGAMWARHFGLAAFIGAVTQISKYLVQMLLFWGERRLLAHNKMRGFLHGWVDYWTVM